MSQTVKFGDIFALEDRSNLRAENGQDSGAFPFYTSRLSQTKFIDQKNYNGEAIIIGIEGLPNVNFEEEGFSTSANCLVYKLKSRTDFKPKFIYYYLLGNKQILAEGFRGAARQILSKTYIENIRIPGFALEHQSKLIDYFDKMYQAITFRQKSLELLNRYLVSSFLVVNNSAKSTKPIREVVNDVKSGPSGKTLNKGMYLNNISEKLYKIYTHKDLADDLDLEDQSQTNYINQSLYESGKFYNHVVQKNDVLITRLGIMGKALVISDNSEEGIINSNLFKVRLNSEVVLPEYFHSLIKSPFTVSKLNRLAHGTAIQTLSKEKLGALIVPIPPIEIQEEFVELKSRTLEQKRLYKRSLQILEKYLASVIYYTFNPHHKPEEIDFLINNKPELIKLLLTVEKPENNENSGVSEFQYLKGIEKLFKVLDRTIENREATIRNNSEENQQIINQKLVDGKIVVELNNDDI